MGNMSYCRFENTEKDLSDCEFALGDFLSGDSSKLSRTELKAAIDLIVDCKSILSLIEEYSGLDPEQFSDAIDVDIRGVVTKVMNDAQKTLESK